MNRKEGFIKIVEGGKQRFSLALKKLQLNSLFYYVSYFHRRHPRSIQPRILIVVYGGLGDSLLCGTLFHHLKKEWPERMVEVVTGSGVPIFSHMPSVDTIITASANKILGRGWPGRNFRQFVQFLAMRGYAEAVELLGMVSVEGLNSAFTGLVLWATDAPVRIGRKGIGNILWKDAWHKGKKIFSSIPHSHKIVTHLFDPSDPRTRTKHESLLSRRALGREYRPMPDFPQLASVEGFAGIWAEELLKRFSEEGKYLVVGVNMETSYALKGWPEERFLKIMERGKKEGLRFVIVGIRSPALSDRIKAQLKEALLDLSGTMDLEQLMALVGRCDLFFSADTGVAHLAQAYKVPTLVLFGPSNDREFAPLCSMHTSLVAKRDCAGPPCVMGPCVVGRSCMLNIAEKEVAAALLSMARKKRAGAYPIPKLPAGTHKEIISFQ